MVGGAAARQRIALVAAIVAIVLFGANFSIQKHLFDLVTPTGFLLARYLIMPACALILLLHRYGTRFPRLPRREMLALAWLGFAGHFLHVGMVTYGIHWSTAFSSSLILACGPIFTLVILRVMGIERLRRWQVIGVGVAFAGVVVFLSDKLMAGHWRATGGDLFLLFASSIFSYYTVISKPLVERHGAVLVMAYATVLGSIPVVLVALPVGLAAPWGAMGPLDWVALILSVVVSSFIGWLVWAWVNAVRGVARTAPLMYLMPPIAGMIAWFFADERYGLVKLLGAAITLGGVALAQFAAGRPKESPAQLD